MSALARLALAALLSAMATATVVQPSLGQATPKAFAPRDEDVKEYPAGPGRDDTFYACTACHAFKIVAQQGLSREQWDESLTWMTARHKMPDIQGKDRQIILDYLATHYGPKPTGGRPAWKNPFSN